MAMAAESLIAHRGYPRHYPENSLAGIEAAIRAGARYIEVDVQLSADGVAVLFHDRDLRRLCGRDGALHERNWRELRGFFVQGPQGREPLARLRDLTGLLQSAAPVTVFVELKRIALEQLGVARVLETVLADLRPVRAQCVIISYSLPALAALRERGRWPLGVVADDWRELKQPSVQALRPEYLFCDLGSLPGEGRLEIPGARLAVYECTDAVAARALLARGVDLVETFAIGEMLAALEQAGTP